MSNRQLDLARSRAAAAREQMLTTAQELQYRLRPSTLADDAKEALWRKSEELADGAVDVVMARPVTVSATVAGVGALLGAGLFFRHRAKNKAEK